MQILCQVTYTTHRGLAVIVNAEDHSIWMPLDSASDLLDCSIHSIEHLVTDPAFLATTKEFLPPMESLVVPDRKGEAVHLWGIPFPTFIHIVYWYGFYGSGVPRAKARHLLMEGMRQSMADMFNFK